MKLPCFVLEAETELLLVGERNIRSFFFRDSVRDHDGGGNLLGFISSIQLLSTLSLV